MPADVLATATVQNVGFPLGTVAGPIRFTATGPVTVVDDETDLDAFFAALPNGTYTFTAVRRNSTNTANLGTPVTQAGVVIPFVQPPPPDTVKPIVTILEPLEGAILSGIVVIRYLATDNVKVETSIVLINGEELPDSPPNQDPPLPWMWVSSLVPDGDYTITARAFDTAGNVGTDSIAVSVLNTPEETSDDELMAACVGVA